MPNAIDNKTAQYLNDVFEYVQRMHGEAGLAELANGGFEKHAAEYNEAYIKMMDKVLNLEGEKKDAFYGKLSQSFFIQAHINLQQQSLRA